MDIGTITGWGQLIVWGFAGIAFCIRLYRGQVKMPNWLSSNLLIGALISAGLAASIVSLYSNQRPSYSDDISGLKRIEKQKFMHQEVYVDGKEFLYCEFTNVTFVFNGTTPVRLLGNTYVGKNSFRTDSVEGGRILSLMFATGLISLPPDVRLDIKGGDIELPKKMN